MPISLPMPYLRSVAEAFMPDLADVARYVETSTSDGISQAWTTIATGLACSIWPSGAAAAEGLGAATGLRAISTWTVRLPALTDVTVRDRIIVGDGRVFEIQRVDARTYEAARDCICELVE